jgi:hypothetical protein
MIIGMDEVTVESVMAKIKEVIDVESDQAYTIGMSGGDDFSDEQRVRADAVPSLEEIERDIGILARSMAAHDE